MGAGKVNLDDAFAKIDMFWSPRLAGMVNDCAIKLARLDGAFCWHHHEAEDEAFVVLAGVLTMHVRDEQGERSIVLGPGEMIVVPRGVEHMPEAREGEVRVMLIEPTSTVNTGNVVNERTVKVLKGIDE